MRNGMKSVGLATMAAAVVIGVGGAPGAAMAASPTAQNGGFPYPSTSLPAYIGQEASCGLWWATESCKDWQAYRDVAYSIRGGGVAAQHAVRNLFSVTQEIPGRAWVYADKPYSPCGMRAVSQAASLLNDLYTQSKNNRKSVRLLMVAQRAGKNPTTYSLKVGQDLANSAAAVSRRGFITGQVRAIRLAMYSSGCGA